MFIQISITNFTGKSETSELVLLDENREVLLRCIDCNIRFLSNLEAREILRYNIKQEIEAERTPYSKNTKLLQCLKEIGTSNNKIIEQFLHVLRETEQDHIANLLTGNKNGNPNNNIELSYCFLLSYSIDKPQRMNVANLYTTMPDEPAYHVWCISS